MEHLPIIVAGILYLTRIREFLIKRDTIKGPVKEKASFVLLFVGGTLTTIAAMVEYLLLDRPPSLILVIIGAIVTLSSFAYRNWAIRTLGRFWSVHVEIRENHTLIDTGPFRRVRHPVYAAAIGELVGIVLILQAYYASLIILLIVVPSIVFRIRIEEKALIHKFGAQYIDYKNRAGALTPKIT